MSGLEPRRRMVDLTQRKLKTSAVTRGQLLGQKLACRLSSRSGQSQTTAGRKSIDLTSSRSAFSCSTSNRALGSQAFGLGFAIFAALMATGCSLFGGVSYLVQTAGDYRTDTSANIFFSDVYCCRDQGTDMAHPDSIQQQLYQRFPLGTRAELLTDYVEGWGGECFATESGATRCVVLAELYRPTVISRYTLNSVEYVIEWIGSDQIRSYVAVERTPTFLGPIPEQQWRQGVESQAVLGDTIRSR